MGAFALLTPVIAAGDAVSNDVIGMRDALIEAGHHARIFAGNASAQGGDVESLERMWEWNCGAEAVAILHFSIGWPAGRTAFDRWPGKKVVRYHNVTPPEFFEGYNDEYEAVCLAGRREIDVVANAGYDLYLSCSEYSAKELIAAGVAEERSAVLPPFHQADRLVEAQADMELLDRFRDGRLNVLAVGRLAPNKNHLPLLAACGIYRRHYSDALRLIVVGRSDPRLERYTARMRDCIRAQRIGSNVEFLEGLDEAKLKSCFLAAHVFATTSLHEGFCVPLIESMAIRVPIMALSRAAVAETAAGAGLVWPEEDPWLFAESFRQLRENPAVGRALTESAAKKYETLYSNERIRQCFLSAL
ncbi:MAG: glycosyltransferase [Rudaea sp.]|uniref:glycosyltransferase n=1 Tax=Rudaea sp. TaxID=2136325 RepID=UPI0039E70448